MLGFIRAYRLTSSHTRTRTHTHTLSADRCTFANRPLALTPELPQEAGAVHTLSATANLPSILAIYPSVELCLETKICSDLGVVRGCPVLVEDILFAENEPSLLLHGLYIFFFVLLSHYFLFMSLPCSSPFATEVLRPRSTSTTSSTSAPS